MTSKKLATGLLVIAGGLLCSCGSAKNFKSSQDEIGRLQAENHQLKTTIDALQKQAADLSAQNTSLIKQYTTIYQQFDGYKEECQAAARELENMKATVKELRRNAEKIEDRIASALTEFESRGLDVYSEDGVIYVDMQDNLLYKSSSAMLSKDGRKALGNLASVLNEFPKLKVTVVGNTDIIKVKGVTDNWTLSTERANGVVRLLEKEYKMDPARLTAAGRGKFSPIADNSTVEGRIKNRRTEIVLNPEWDKVWENVSKE